MVVFILCLVSLGHLAWAVILHVEIEKLKGEIPRSKARQALQDGAAGTQGGAKGMRSFTIG